MVDAFLLFIDINHRFSLTFATWKLQTCYYYRYILRWSILLQPV